MVNKNKFKGKIEMKKVMLVSIAIILIFCNVVTADSVTTTSPINITAGSSFDLNYTIAYSGQKTLCYVTVTIEPDSEGINLTYVSPFVLYRGVQTFTISIKTNLALKPQIYNITAIFSVKKISVQKPKIHFHNDSEIPTNGTDNQTNPPEDNETEDIIPPSIPGIVEEEEESNLWIYILIVIIIAIISFLLLLRRRRMKK